MSAHTWTYAAQQDWYVVRDAWGREVCRVTAEVVRQAANDPTVNDDLEGFIGSPVPESILAAFRTLRIVRRPARPGVIDPSQDMSYLIIRDLAVQTRAQVRRIKASGGRPAKALRDLMRHRERREARYLTRHYRPTKAAR